MIYYQFTETKSSYYLVPQITLWCLQLLLSYLLPVITLLYHISDLVVEKTLKALLLGPLLSRYQIYTSWAPLEAVGSIVIRCWTPKEIFLLWYVFSPLSFGHLVFSFLEYQHCWRVLSCEHSCTVVVSGSLSCRPSRSANYFQLRVL